MSILTLAHILPNCFVTVGLGKTVQAIAFIQSLFEEGYFPFLVVAPLSTLGQWDNEFARWAPKLNTLIYSGTKASVNSNSIVSKIVIRPLFLEGTPIDQRARVLF